MSLDRREGGWGGEPKQNLVKEGSNIYFPCFCFAAVLLLSHFVSLPGDDGKGGGSSALHLQTPAAIGQ